MYCYCHTGTAYPFLALSPLHCDTLAAKPLSSVFAFPSYLSTLKSKSSTQIAGQDFNRTLPLFFLHSVFFPSFWERIPHVRDLSDSWIFEKWGVRRVSLTVTYYHLHRDFCKKRTLLEKNSNLRIFLWTKNIHHLKKKSVGMNQVNTSRKKDIVDISRKKTDQAVLFFAGKKPK